MTDGIISWSEDNGIVTLTIDDPSQRVNTMNSAYISSMEATLSRLADRADELTGVIITSGKETFFAGGDLHDLLATTPADAGALTDFTNTAKGQLRRLESLGVPIVAALHGSALGGGLEIALACHHRIAVNTATLRVGLPEVTLGLLPGGGGIVRSVRLLGLAAALDSVLLPGTAHTAQAALDLGLIDDLVTEPDELLTRARAWLNDSPSSTQPWDNDDVVPGGTAYSPEVEATLATRAAALRAQHHGSPMQASAHILAAAVESTQTDVDAAFAIETRYFVELATGQISKNIIQGTFLDRRAVRAGVSRPAGHPPRAAHRLAVLGAGLMGTGIALTAARAGLEVCLKDVDLDGAQCGKARIERTVSRLVGRGSLTAAEASDILARIETAADVDGLGSPDVVIEAVFENPQLKAQVMGEVLDHLSPDCLLASNTSTLPITDLARSVDRPEDFLGLHFFSPVERMDLVELIVGEQTSDATVARGFDLARQLGKTPIVVGDGRGFFTSRVILQRLLEAAAMLGEGFTPSTIEQASLQAGYPLGTLALIDEVSLKLPHTIFAQFKEDAAARGRAFNDHPGHAVLTAVINQGRLGRGAGAGFYEYEEGRRGRLWPGLFDMFEARPPGKDLNELVDRLLFSEALETARCLESGIVRSSADANVGSLAGIGFPAWTGGAAQFVAGYPGGPSGFDARACELVTTYGARFEPLGTRQTIEVGH